MSPKRWVFEDKAESPAAQAAILGAVGNQIDGNDPPEARQAFERIRREGYSGRDAKKLIGACLSLEIWHTLHPQGGGYDRQRYVTALNGLPSKLPEGLDE